MKSKFEVRFKRFTFDNVQMLIDEFIESTTKVICLKILPLNFEQIRGAFSHVGIRAQIISFTDTPEMFFLLTPIFCEHEN